MDYEPEGMLQSNPAAERTNLPGIFLLIVGVLNILGALFLLLQGVQAMMLSPEQRQEAKRAADAFLPAQQREQMKQRGWTMDKIVDLEFGALLPWGGLALAAGIVTLIGGLQMRSLRSYGLAVTASILALIPCLSLAGCCGLGEGIGIWTLIVLMNSDVKAAFR